MKLNQKTMTGSHGIDCEREEGEQQDLVVHKTRNVNSSSDVDYEQVMCNVSKSLNQTDQKVVENQQIADRSQLTINVASCHATEGDSSPLFSRPSPTQKLDELSRRARIFDSCKVNSPSLILAASPLTMAAGNTVYYRSITETLQEMKKESGEKFSSITNQRRNMPDPFQFPHRPIEQITLLNSEVELERQSAKRKQTLKSNADAANATFNNEDESTVAKRRPASPPEFDKLSFEGENVSGVKETFPIFLQDQKEIERER